MRLFSPSPGFAKLLAPLAGLALAAALAVPAIYWAERSSLSAWSRKAERFVPKKAGRELYHAPGVTTPPTIAADRAELVDDAPVVGVESGGKFRAYHLGTMRAKARHVVNDVIGVRAVSVSYCDLDDCVRAFAADGATAPLAIAVEGLADGGMLIGVDGVAYFQKTGEGADAAAGQAAPRFPYAEFPAERTTWGRWKALHPDTDVYFEPPPGPSAPEPAAPGR